MYISAVFLFLFAVELVNVMATDEEREWFALSSRRV